LNISRDEADSFVDDISDYDYEDEQEATVRPTPKARQQFGKSLNGNLRKAGKMLAKPERKHELEFELKETSDNIEDESDTKASSVTPVIDGYNQSDSTTPRGELSALTTTTMPASDNDDIVEINTSSTTAQSEATSSTIYVIENDFQIKQKQKLEEQDEDEGEGEEEKPVADDSNNERDLADNYEEHKDMRKGQPELPTQSINHTVSDLMLNDAAHFDNDDIDIVKLDEPPNSNEVDIYKMAVEQAKVPQPQQQPPAPPPPPSSENEVLKEQETKVEKAAHLIPLKPYVSERFDRPSKRILVNLTIATDDGSDSIYTLHVAVPTGGGSHNVEQVLTHESNIPHEDNNIDALNLGTCSSEPPPQMPDCPCNCLPPPSPTFLSNDNNEIDTDSATSLRMVKGDDEDHSNDNKMSQLASVTASSQTVATSTATNDYSTEFDNNIAATDTVTHNDSDNVTARSDEKFACPDVMPILILEGDCTVCSHC